MEAKEPALIGVMLSPGSWSFFLLFIFISAVHAAGMAQQDKQTDSLLNVIKTQKEDTNRVNTLNALSRRYSVTDNYVLSNKYAEQAISLATKLNFKRGFILSYANLGLNNEAEGNYPAAMNNFLTMLKYSEETGSKKSIAAAYNNIGFVLSSQGKSIEAINNYRISAKLNNEIGDKN